MTSTFQIEIENLSHLSHYLNHSILYQTIILFMELHALDEFSRGHCAFSVDPAFGSPWVFFCFFLLMHFKSFLLLFFAFLYFLLCLH